MNKLLAISDGALTLIIVGVIFAVGITAFVLIKIYFGKDVKNASKNMPNNFNVEINKQFLNKAQKKFLSSVNTALPSEFVAFPNICVCTLLVPHDDKNLFNKVNDKYLDVVIFLKESMEPVLAVDLYDEASTDKLEQIDEYIKKALDEAKLPVIRIVAQEEYEIGALRKKLIDAMPAKIMTLLKEHYIQQQADRSKDVNKK